MFRLMAVLCIGLFLALLIGGRDTGQVRMGLAGYYPPLVAPAPDRTAAVPTEAPSLPAPAAVVTRAAFQPDLVETTAVQEGLTLSLPLVRTPVPEAAVTEAAVAPAPAEGEILGVAYVTGSTVNIRETPSAKATVVEKLTRGEAVTVLASDTPGWSMIRIEGDGLEGYVASRYLSDAAQDGAALAAD